MVALFVFTCLPASAAVWKHHPAVDDFPMRIAGGNGNTYFFVFQRMYKTGTSSFRQPHVAVFRHNDSRSAEGIVPLANEVALNGYNVMMAEYSPEGAFLTLVYDDGGIDFVADSGEVRHSDMLKQIGVPGWSRINSLTMCGTEAWIATDAGYAAVDGLTGETIGTDEIGKPVKWAARVGDRIVIVADNALRAAPTTPFPRDYAAFAALGASGTPANPKLLMPLSDSAFGYLADPTPNAGTFSLNVAWIDGGAWKTRKLQDIWLPTAPANAMVANLFERNVTRNRDGWLLVTAGNFFQLYKDRNPADSQMVEALTANLIQTVGGSPDFENFWTYVSRGGYRHGHRDGQNVIWDETTMRPKAPAANVATRLSYSSEFGIVASNYGFSWIFGDLSANQPVQISGYKDGDWREYSPLYNMPASAAADESLASLYNTYTWRFPVSDPYSLEFDPVYQTNVWMGSPFGGIAAVDMAHPDSDPVHIASSMNPLSAYPGFKAMIPDCNRWNGYDPMSTPSFDGDGTLWTLYNRYDATSDGKESIRIYYWTAADRKNAIDTRRFAESPDMGWFALNNSGSGGNATMKLLALRKPRNKNLLIAFISSQNRLYRVDHNGTLSDTSDDAQDLFTDVSVQTGGVWPLTYCHAWAEDPVTGDVWVGAETQLVAFDPVAKPENGVMPGRVLDLEYGEQQGNPFDNLAVYGIAFDDRNRMWISTDGAGVWCISADRKRVEEHYTTANSGLPSDTAYGMAWNPETQSLMISTAEGLAEVWPELPSASAANENGPTVWPRNVKADYAGGVVIRGLSGNARVFVTDRDGHVVTGFDADPSGAAVWDLTDGEGRPVATGVYRIESSASDFEPVEVTVLR